MKISVPLRVFPPSVVEYAAGLPLGEIAARYGVTPKTVRMRARLMGVPPRKVKLDGARLKRAIALYRRGWGWKQICAVVHTDRTTLSDALKRKGVRLRSGHR